MVEHPAAPWSTAPRLAALAACGILDTAPEADFDDLAALASELCDVPIALITFVETERQWFKAAVGTEIRENAARHSFCVHALAADNFLMVPDARLDPRFVDNPVVKALDLRFYAGVPLRSPDGHAIGTICVYDHRPRELTPVQIRALERLGRQVARLLALRQALQAQLKVEQALRDSEAYVRLLLDSTAEGFYAVDVDGRTTLCNPASLALLGFERDTDILGRELHPIIHHHHGDGTPYPTDTCPIHLCARTGRPAHIADELFYRADGTAFPVEYWVHPIVRDGRLEGAVCTFRDVTARRAAETALRDSEARLRALNADLERQVIVRTRERGRTWAVTPDLLSVIGPSGRLQAVNPAWTTLLGWSADELLGFEPFALLHPDDRAAVRTDFVAPRGDQPFSTLENRLAHRDGSYRWLAWTIVPEEERYYCIARDITREKARQAELELAQDALRQSQKLEAMGQLTGGVAHDFNNLLTPIIGSLDMLQRQGVGTDRQQRMIGGAMQSAERAQMLVQRLLAFARRQPLSPSAVDVGILIAGMADLITSTSGPKVRVLVDVADGLPPAVADANQVEMAILNLAVNARDAMPNGGTLTIAAAPETARDGHRAGLAPGDYVRLAVSDTGTGMDETTIARAIEPFFSTKGIGKGTGLGLSMVHGLAAQLGGGLAITSRRGLGTRIELWLPVSADASMPSSFRPAGPVPATAAGTALVIDDEELVRLSTADMLADLGYTVLQAASAEDGLARIVDGPSVDLVVTDHLMPGMTGVTLARTLRASWPELPVLIVSGYADVDSLDPDLPRLAKPFRQSDLAAVVATLRQQ